MSDGRTGSSQPDRNERPSSVFALARRRASDVASRWSTTVETIRVAAQSAATKEERWLVGYESERLLWRVLFDAETLVRALNEDSEDEDVEKFAKSLYESLRARRLARKLENVEGRTPEEAEAFTAKARELRGE